jgi:hypothetical protein
MDIPKWPQSGESWDKNYIFQSLLHDNEDLRVRDIDLLIGPMPNTQKVYPVPQGTLRLRREACL